MSQKRLIPKGKMVAVSVKSDNIQDKRFFVHSTKLRNYLLFLKKNAFCGTIRIKQFNLN